MLNLFSFWYRFWFQFSRIKIRQGVYVLRWCITRIFHPHLSPSTLPSGSTELSSWKSETWKFKFRSKLTSFCWETVNGKELLISILVMINKVPSLSQPKFLEPDIASMSKLFKNHFSWWSWNSNIVIRSGRTIFVTNFSRRMIFLIIFVSIITQWFYIKLVLNEIVKNSPFQSNQVNFKILTLSAVFLSSFHTSESGLEGVRWTKYIYIIVYDENILTS